MIKLVSLSFFLFFSCSKEQGPSEYLKDFVDYRFSGSQTIDGLIERSEGPLKERLESLDEQDKDDYLKLGNLKYRNFKVNVESCSQQVQECNITYTLSYDQLKNGKGYNRVVVKKIAQIKMIEGSWKITDIDEVKTHFESVKSIDP